MKSIFFIFLFLCFNSYSQLDSISVTTSMIEITLDADPSVADSLRSGSVLEVKIWVNEMASLGTVVVDFLYESPGISFLKLQYTAAEIIQNGFISDGWIVLRSGFLNPDNSYIVKTSVRNLQLIDVGQAVNHYHPGN